jgi:hypothetical protein
MVERAMIIYYSIIEMYLISSCNVIKNLIILLGCFLKFVFFVIHVD